MCVNISHKMSGSFLLWQRSMFSRSELAAFRYVLFSVLLEDLFLVHLVYKIIIAGGAGGMGGEDVIFVINDFGSYFNTELERDLKVNCEL